MQLAIKSIFSIFLFLFLSKLLLHVIDLTLTLFKMGFFLGGGAAHRQKRGQKGPYPKICHTYPTMMKLVSYTLPKEDMNHMTHQLGSADQHFSLEISKFCYIKKYTDCILLFSFLILLIFLESLKIVLINMVPISMMSVKKTKLGLLNIKLF